jgi:hypothetical protein
MGPAGRAWKVDIDTTSGCIAAGIANDNQQHNNM